MLSIRSKNRARARSSHIFWRSYTCPLVIHNSTFYFPSDIVCAQDIILEHPLRDLRTWSNQTLVRHRHPSIPKGIRESRFERQTVDNTHETPPEVISTFGGGPLSIVEIVKTERTWAMRRNIASCTKCLPTQTLYHPRDRNEVSRGTPD